MSCRHRLARHVRRLIVWLCSSKPRLCVSVTADSFEFDNLIIDGRAYMASTLRDGKKLRIRFRCLDRDGFEVPLPAPPTFTVDDPTLATVTVNGQAADVSPTKPFRLGTVKVTGSVPGHPELGTLEYTINLAAGDPARLAGEVEVVDDEPDHSVDANKMVDPASVGDGHQVVS